MSCLMREHQWYKVDTTWSMCLLGVGMDWRYETLWTKYRKPRGQWPRLPNWNNHYWLWDTTFRFNSHYSYHHFQVYWGHPFHRFTDCSKVSQLHAEGYKVPILWTREPLFTPRLLPLDVKLQINGILYYCKRSTGPCTCGNTKPAYYICEIFMGELPGVMVP